MLEKMNAENLSERESKKNVSDEYFELKHKIHDRLIDLIDLPALEKLDHHSSKSQIRNLVESILHEDGDCIPLNSIEIELLIAEIQHEVLGLGPLEPFLQDPTISDVLVNTYKQIYVERFGKLELTEARFKDDAHLMKIVDKIVSLVGRRIDESSPMVDARLQDGSRVNVIIPPLSIDGPIVSIRRFAVDPLEMEDLMNLSSLTPEIAEILKGIIKSRLNVLISGGTGSGKTTLLNVLSRFIPEKERIVTIEDSAELQLKQEHVIRVETRPPNIEGKGEVTQRDLVRNSLRMRPDRIIVGEVRGQEAFDMLQAMNTGHDGSLTTIHANTPRDALMRLESMVSMTSFDIPLDFIRKYVSSAIDILIHLERLTDGTRKMMSLQEITGMEGNIITLQEVFSFQKKTIDAEGRVRGSYMFHGIRPRFIDKFHAAGIKVNNKLFDETHVVEM
jgi:pilus assembly protein CpaF